MSELNERIKIAAREVRQRGEPVEVYWADTDEPYDEKIHGSWGGDLAFLNDLRAWIKTNGADGRTVTIYCRGDHREVKL